MDTVYVISNPLFPNYIKIGHTKCLYSRLMKLNTGVPLAYNVIFAKKVKNAKKIESLLHSRYRGDYMLNLKTFSKEWYPVENVFFDNIEEFLTDIKKSIEEFTKKVKVWDSKSECSM